MRINPFVRFILESIVVGLAAALVILIIWPELIGGKHNNTGDISHYSGNGSYRTAVRLAAPAVINVYASKIYQQRLNPLFQDPLFQRFFGYALPEPNTRRDSNLGSGVIMNADGIILTNAHVIKGKDEIGVTLNDGRQAAARIIGIDDDTDLAVLKIELTNLPAIPVGNSDVLEVGDIVLAIGNPYDFGQTVTQGIVSAKGRKRMGITTFEDFIQTDADINPGNSGGALINSNGQLIGINTAIVSNTGGSQGIGLATPINLALSVMQGLIQNGRIVRGWLGIEAQILPTDIQREANLGKGGVLVAGVLNDGPADKAGIIPGDIIIEVAGEAVMNPQHAIQKIAQLTPGSNVEIHILRGWKEMSLTARIAERPVFRH